MRDHLVSMKNIFNKDYYGQFVSFSFSTVENLQAARGGGADLKTAVGSCRSSGATEFGEA
jgi:hypothetical protein